MRNSFSRIVAVVTLAVATLSSISNAQMLELNLRYQIPVGEAVTTQPGESKANEAKPAEKSTRPLFHRLSRQESWPAQQTAVIVCDMWDSHHCVNAVRRVQEVAPMIDRFVNQMRDKGATIIHAPSSCMDAYKDHPARVRATQIPSAPDFPDKIDAWCDQITNEQPYGYPLDQAEGGEDDDLAEHQHWAEQLAAQGRNSRAPWKSQIAAIKIDSKLDFVSDSGREIWSILQNRAISKVMLVGVHTNMCVLGRPFGLRRLAQAGKQVVLVRDLTDTMYDPRAWPYANHFTGTDIIVDHVERFVCPTISSNQVLGGREFRFSGDARPQLTMIIAEDEYRTEQTLPEFAARHLSQHFRVTYAFGSSSERNKILSLEDLATADAVLVSVRRRPLPEADLKLIQQWARSGKPMIGIRTASHPFSLRTGQPEAGLAQWPEFDREIWGGNYTNHYGNDLKADLRLEETAKHAILQAIGQPFTMKSGGSLYKVSPLAPGTSVLLRGSIKGQPEEPIAWTNVRADGGRSFYTSLGHVDDFAQPQFQAFLAAGIHWACNLPIPNLETVSLQNQRYAEGHGRQRK